MLIHIGWLEKVWMTTSDGTFSSALFRQRDKVIEEKHQKELGVLQQKIFRYKRDNDEILKDLFDTRNNCDRLARSLGFKNVEEARVAIDKADHLPVFKEFLERGDQQDDEILILKAKNEELEDTIIRMTKEQDVLKAQLVEAERSKELAKCVFMSSRRRGRDSTDVEKRLWVTGKRQK
jgi:hypothetical protein